MKKSINRDAGDKFKGVRLQKLRVIELMLDAISRSENVQIYGAIEYGDDVFLSTTTSDVSTAYYEQNKNYSDTVKFTLNSIEILKALVNFLDIWIEKGMSGKNICMGFYTTCGYGKEMSTAYIKSSNLNLPSEPYLKILSYNEPLCTQDLATLKSIVIKEYEKQYEDKQGMGFLEDIKKFSDAKWREFLKTIHWRFGSVDDVVLTAELIEKIRKSSYFTSSLNGKEELILDTLVELVEKKQAVQDVTEKFVHASDVKNVFLEIDAGNIRKKDDPIYEIWNNLPEPGDKRNILDKIKAVCPNYKGRSLNLMAQKATAGLIEKRNFESDKNFQSFRYRIYNACQTELIQIIELSENRTFSEAELVEIVDRLFRKAESTINDLEKVFNYSYTSNTIIENVIVELFDSCFLAFN
jgi:hypothetical protein